jgi:trk system potassium uptake protein TrkH
VAVNWIAFLVILGAIGFPVIITLEKRILEILHKFLERKIIAYEETQLLVRAIQGENVGFLIRIAQATEKLGEFIERYNHNLNSGTHPIQTKILLRGTIYLLMTSTIIIMILEWNSPNYILGDGFWDKLHHAFFLAACSRSAGFNIVPLSELSTASFVTIILLMGIGGAPQGTAGGLKITTFVILIAYIKNLFNPEEKITVYGKEISKVSSAVAIRLYLLTTVVLGIYLLLLTTLHRGFSLEFVAFEMVSAFGTVGYSLGITPFIGDVEKLLYSLLMFMGRVGILNLLVAFSGHSGIPKIPETGDPVRLQVG